MRTLLLFLSIAAIALAAPPKVQLPVVVVMLDVNDTMLREVDLAYAGRAGVQTLQYTPSPGRVARFGLGTNYVRELGNGKVETALGLRPGMEAFFERLFPLVADGKVRIVLTSLDDNERTKAIAGQVKVGGKALIDWGVETLHPVDFHESHGVKDIAMFRRAPALNRQTG